MSDPASEPVPERKVRLANSLARLVRLRELEAPIAFILEEKKLAREHRIHVGDTDLGDADWSPAVRAAAEELGLLGTDVAAIADALERSKIEDEIFLDVNAAAQVTDLKVMLSLGVATVMGTVGYDFDAELVAETIGEIAGKFAPVTIENQVRYVPAAE